MHFWVPWIWNNQMGSSQKTTTLRVLQTADWNVPPLSLEKGLMACPGASGWGAHFRFISSKSHGGTECRSTLLWLCCNSLAPMRNDLTHTTIALIFANCSQKDTFRWPDLEASRIYNCSPTGQYIFTYLKNCCLGVWLLISLKLGANWGLSPWNTHRSLNTWDLSRINQAAYTTTKVECPKTRARLNIRIHLYTRPCL